MPSMRVRNSELLRLKSGHGEPPFFKHEMINCQLA